MKILNITKEMYLSGSAYADWTDDGTSGRIGGPYADMLCAFSDDNDPISLVAMVDGIPAGQINLLKGAVILEGDRWVVYWGAGLHVLPANRSTGASIALLAKMRAMSPGSGAVSVSRQAAPLYLKLGWFGFAAHRYFLPVHPSTVLKNRFGGGALVRAGGLLIDGAVAIHRYLLRAALALFGPKCSTKEVSRFDETEDCRFEAHTTLPYTTERSSLWLNRVISEGPKDNDRRLFLVHDRNQKVVGYFVTAVALRRGVDNDKFGDLLVASLRDWVAFRSGGLNDADVMLLGLKQLLAISCDIVEICVPQIQSATPLRIMGMIRMGDLNFVLRLTPSAHAKYPDLTDPSKWWFRPGDGDAFLL
jgi:hypothetical protein